MRRVVAGMLLLAAVAAGPAMALSAMQMVQRALQATQSVQDYVADVTVTVDAPSLQIPPRTAKVYYKRPDKVHVQSQGITVLPRDALLLGNLASYLERYAAASFTGSGTLNGRPVRCIKLSPTQSEAGSGRVLVWIDTERYLLLKSEIWRAGRRMLTVSFEHAQVSGHWMPRRIVAELAPGALSGEDEGGRMELTFANYRVNAGIPDAIFEEGQ
ncbi:MAG: outer membrane lipoprotein-sorting protein [Armatimonadota bacterium]